MNVLDQRITKLKNKKKFLLTVLIILSVLLVASISLCVALANYKIQTLMTILGSALGSIFGIAIIYLVFAFYLPLIDRIHFLEDIDQKSLKTFVVDDFELIGKITLKRNIVAIRYLIGGSEYLVIDEKLSLQIGCSYLVYQNIVLGPEHE